MCLVHCEVPGVSRALEGQLSALSSPLAPGSVDVQMMGEELLRREVEHLTEALLANAEQRAASSAPFSLSPGKEGSKSDKGQGSQVNSRRVSSLA